MAYSRTFTLSASGSEQDIVLTNFPTGVSKLEITTITSVSDIWFGFSTDNPTVDGNDTDVMITATRVKTFDYSGTFQRARIRTQGTNHTIPLISTGANKIHVKVLA